jgi:hypothetical protein
MEGTFELYALSRATTEYRNRCVVALPHEGAKQSAGRRTISI